MKICFIGKYPPIEGGESSKLYWLARGLGDKGHIIHVVTNALEVENEYREKICENIDLDSYQPNNVYIHNTNPFLDLQFIPFNNPYIAKLANLSIEVIRNYNLQIIDSWYILPYCISGYIAKIFTHKPQILRHAGSDLNRLFFNRDLNTIFTEIIKAADIVVTYTSRLKQFIELGVSESNIFMNKKVSVNPEFFNPNVKPIDLSKFKKFNPRYPVITYIGKFGYTKGIIELLFVLSQIKQNFNLLLVTGGKNLNILKKIINEYKLSPKTIIIGFVPPWKIPSIIKASTCVVHAENEFPISSHSPILPYEVMAVGSCLVLSEELYKKRKSEKIKNKENIIVVNPKNTENFKNIIQSIIENPNIAEKIGKAANKISLQIEDFENYITQTEYLYESALKRQK